MGIQTYTGGDNLDGGKSTAVLFVTLNNGQTLECYLNVPVPQGQTQIATSNQTPPIPQLGGGTNTTYNNDSTAPSGCNINNIAGTLFVGASVYVALYQKSCDTYCDNWDLEGVSLTLYANSNGDPSGGTTCELKAGFWGPGDHGENPGVARLKGGQGTGLFNVAQSPSYKIPSGC